LPRKSAAWSAQRRDLAQRIASIVYGVIAVTTTDLVVQPDNFRYREAVEGALLIGLAMMVTRMFVAHRHARSRDPEASADRPGRRDPERFDAGDAVSGIGGGCLAAASFTAIRPIMLLDVIFYAGIASIFAIGFLSRYILDRQLWLALLRGAQWTILSLILLAAKIFY